MKLISGWGCGKIDQPLISGDKIVEFGIAEIFATIELVRPNMLVTIMVVTSMLITMNS
jgi:hypothetical protein